MRIIINGTEFSQIEMDTWKRKRIHKVLRNLKKTLPMTETTDVLCDRLTTLKINMSYEEIISSIKSKLVLGEIGMKLATLFFKNKRRNAITTIYTSGIKAEKFTKIIDSLMIENKQEYRKANLAACPDHYVLKASDGILEVIETTGNMPVPTQFFITFGDETGLKEPRNPTYPYQSTGIAKLKDGTIIGGVRHQFRDTEHGLEVRTLVEFPFVCPKTIIKEHQKHLAVEWSNWIHWAIKHQSQF